MATGLQVSRDIVSIHADYDYTTIGVAVLAIFKHVREYYDFSFLLKVRTRMRHAAKGHHAAVTMS